MSDTPTPTREERIETALGLIADYGGIDGAHHKQWVLDQVVRALCGATPDDQDDYLAWVAAIETGVGGSREYEWDVGIAP